MEFAGIYCFFRIFSDTKTTADGAHLDVNITGFDKHKGYEDLYKLNDVAVVYLQHDVIFNGNFEITFLHHFVCEISLIFSSYYTKCNRSH